MPDSIATAWVEATAKLRTAGVEQSRLDAALLLSHTIGGDRTFLIAHGEQRLDAAQAQTFADFVSRRAAGEPLQYITGHQEFFKLDFGVTPDVLVPRPETELIVEAVLDLFPTNAAFSFADVGTGSGCIAISILCERLQTSGTALDKSGPALAVAQRNAERHGVAARVRMMESDLLSALPRDELFDLIVSNPPYVPDPEIESLQREVQHEPVSALAGGPDGLEVIRRLVEEARQHLKRDGFLIFEFGIHQEMAIRELLDRNVWELVEIRKDLQQIPRIIIMRHIPV